MILGKTNLPELAIHGFTESKTFGITRNPWNPERTTGGSSGGSGAAVAAGLAAIAHASDGAGSIRYPAAHCGLFGLKPQRDRDPDRRRALARPVGERLRQPHGRRHRAVHGRRHLGRAVVAERAAAARTPFAEAAAAEPGKLRIALALKPPRALAPPQLGDESRRMAEEVAELLGVARPLRSSGATPTGARSATRSRPATWAGSATTSTRVPHDERLEGITRGYRRIAKVAAPGLGGPRARSSWRARTATASARSSTTTTWC